MKIRMYNVGFGDCYCLRDRKKSLLVDFGTNNSRIEGRPRREIFDLIISDLSTIECKNLLLTHFHMVCQALYKYHLFLHCPHEFSSDHNLLSLLQLQSSLQL